jgi:hypothetical protein
MRRKYLIKVRRSRKNYLWIYMMILIIVGLRIYIRSINGSLDKITIYIALVFIIFLLKFVEIHRIKDWWAVTDSSIIQSTGLLSKNLRSIDFNSISDLDLDQSLYKRILNYGDVNVRLFLNDTSVSIKDINSPGDFIKQLQDIMSKRRSKSHGFKEE